MIVGTARDYLFSLEQFGIKLGLDQIRGLMDGLGRPDRAYRSVVVAGTNGKGSVTAMVERGLRAAGWRTGRYTSPHLIDLEERIVIDGRAISSDELEQIGMAVRASAARLPAPPSFFEATTAVALDAFRRAGVEVAILEVGLGGRLDATNVISPMGVAITSVDFDHEQYLGQTLEAIAREKAGVIKPGCFVVLADNPPEVQNVVREAAIETGADLVPAADGVIVDVTLVDGRSQVRLRTPRADYGSLLLALRGRHQIGNAVAAVRMLEELDGRGLVSVPAAAICTALTDVEWPARLELRHWTDGDVLIDGAHNPAGARALSSYLREAHGRKLPMVVGIMRDKKVDALIEALAPAASQFVFTAVSNPRAATPGELRASAARVAPDVACVEVASPMDAVATALTLGDPVVVAGSLYLAGEVRANLWYTR
jgi:dihydrofolate synthase/folylpolyglutamate synthase